MCKYWGLGLQHTFLRGTIQPLVGYWSGPQDTDGCGVLMSLPYSNSIFAGDFLHNDKLMIARNVTLVLHLRKTHKASVLFFWWGRGGAYVLYLIWWWSNGYTHL